MIVGRVVVALIRETDRGERVLSQSRTHFNILRGERVRKLETDFM